MDSWKNQESRKLVRSITRPTDKKKPVVVVRRKNGAETQAGRAAGS